VARLALVRGLSRRLINERTQTDVNKKKVPNPYASAVSFSGSISAAGGFNTDYESECVLAREVTR
jgi:hypothetical protein